MYYSSTSSESSNGVGKYSVNLINDLMIVNFGSQLNIYI